MTKLKLQFKCNSLPELIKTFSTEQKCINFLEQKIWNGNVISPYDPDSKVYKCKNNQYKCKNTKKFFNVKTGTFLKNTKIKLTDWAIAIWLFCSHKKGILSCQLAKNLGVTQKTAYNMLDDIRKYFGNTFSDTDEQISGIVEIDETKIGGKNKNKPKHKRVKNSQSGKEMAVVMGMLQRYGNVIAKVVKNQKKGTLLPEIYKNVYPNSIVITDKLQSYKSLCETYEHHSVNHRAEEYVRDGWIHTNTIEGFGSVLKAGLRTYHWCSKEHLQKYVDELVFRYNTRGYTEQERFHCFFENMKNRLRYKDLVA